MTPKADDRIELDAGPAVKAFYQASDVVSPQREAPGEYPYTRGVGSARQQPLVRIYTGLGSPEQSSKRLQHLLKLGVEDIQIAADLPSQVGYDADHLMASGEVGRAGVALSSLRDMEVLFEGIPLNSFKRVGMLGNSIGPIALALFIALGERQGLSPGEYVVDLQNDPLKEYIARGTQFLPVGAAVRLAADVVEWCSRKAPHWYPQDACVNHINVAGAGSTRATAFALSNAICYIEDVLQRGRDIDDFAGMLQVFADEREDFFVAIANIRATRRVWARIMRERFGARAEASLALSITAYGHGRETRVEPLNNIARIAFGCLAYRLAGVQTLYSSSFDEALATPSDEAVTISVRTQQIINCEQGFSAVVDPLGGSYYVEALTDEIERDILEELGRIDEQGGAVACIDNGYFAAVIAEGAVRRQRWLEEGRREVVGVNRFVVDGEDRGPAAVAAADQDVEARQRERILAVRRDRDNDRVARLLEEVRRACRLRANTVEPITEAVRAYATIGEIADVLRSELGEWVPSRQV